MIHRLFHQLKIPFEVKNVGLPYLESEFDDALKRLLVQLPLLQNGDIYHKSTLEIISAVCQWQGISSEQRKLANTFLKSVDNTFFTWANSVFLNSLVYLRWIKRRNYNKFIKTVHWGVPDINNENFQETLLETRDKVKAYLQNFPEGTLLEEDIVIILRHQLQKLNEELKSKKYFSDNQEFPDLRDFATFMVVQGLLDPCMEEREYILENYPYVVEWAKIVDKETSPAPTLEL